MKKTYFVGLLLLLVALTSCQKQKTPVDYVNPYMGNISHLLVPTFPTVHLPNSMLRVYPERGDFTSDQINGLPMVVTSHRGSSAFNLSPYQSEDGTYKTVVNYTYDQEKTTPYSYSVYLDNAQIAVEFAPSHQSGIYQLVFEKDADNCLIINTRNGALKADGTGISGYQLVDGGPTKIYLYLETEQPADQVGILDNGKANYQSQATEGRNKAMILQFNKNKKTLNVRYGISFISEAQAQKNLRREIATYNVSEVAEVGRKLWNTTLGKIEVKGSNEEDKILFYTSLYRTYERMINLSEDGQYYSAFDGTVHSDEGTPFYTDDWIWDTYRATHPLRVLIEPKMEIDMVKSYIRMAQQSPQGWMPTFPEVTGDSHRMNGNHAVAVILDAYCKGLTDFDLAAAYDACKGAITEKSLLPWTKVPLTVLDTFYNNQGYFPSLGTDEEEYCPQVHHFEDRQAISVILGNSYDNWCLSEIAKALNKPEEQKKYLNRSYRYRNVYNAQTAFFHPKNKEGEFLSPFDYRFSGGQGARAYYGENNAWVYRWDIQHNIDDLIKLMGGNEQFVANLDATFREPLGRSKYQFYYQLPDHTGNVGQFSMANEPSLHIPYLYNYAGQAWMTQKRIHTLMRQWFRNDLMGVPGDEDGGGMTAFVVFSTMGFYPVTPGSPSYNIGSPFFEEVKIDLGNGKFFEIIAKNQSEDNKYIQSATLNGKEWNKAWFSQSDMIDGKLVLVMGNKANKSWGNGDTPPSAQGMEK